MLSSHEVERPREEPSAGWYFLGILTSLGLLPPIWARNLTVGTQDFPDGPVVKNLPANVEDTGSIPGLGRFHILRSN